MHTNSYKLIKTCGWFAALFPSVVNSVQCKLHHTKRCRYNMPGVIQAQRTCYVVETAKAEVELAKPYFCIPAGLTVSDFWCLILFSVT